MLCSAAAASAPAPVVDTLRRRGEVYLQVMYVDVGVSAKVCRSGKDNQDPHDSFPTIMCGSNQ